MKTIGLIGGMSWESTLSYYRILNTAINGSLGGLHSAKCLLHSVDFQPVEDCQKEGRWEDSGEILAEAARSLERGGADFGLICTNTMHKVFDQVQAAVSIPFLHIADTTVDAVRERNMDRIGLLGTAYTMEQDFYKGRFAGAGIDVLIPEPGERQEINRIIFEELCRGVITDSSKHWYLRAIDGLVAQGCQGIVMGCTEIGLLIQQADTPTPLFDTAEIHALRAARFALADSRG